MAAKLKELRCVAKTESSVKNEMSRNQKINGQDVKILIALKYVIACVKK
jgi:hypothetical protein